MVDYQLDACLFDKELYLIAGGKDLLPRAFLPYLKDNIVFNARVHKVLYGKNGVTLGLKASNLIV